MILLLCCFLFSAVQRLYCSSHIYDVTHTTHVTYCHKGKHLVNRTLCMPESQASTSKEDWCYLGRAMNSSLVCFMAGNFNPMATAFKLLAGTHISYIDFDPFFRNVELKDIPGRYFEQWHTIVQLKYNCHICFYVSASKGYIRHCTVCLLLLSLGRTVGRLVLPLMLFHSHSV